LKKLVKMRRVFSNFLNLENNEEGRGIYRLEEVMKGEID